MNKQRVVFLFFIIIVSCGIKKKTFINQTTPNINSEQIIIKFNENNYSPEWLFLEGDVNINESKENLKIIIKHKKDSITWVSIRANLGIELFRLQITKDSVYFLDRLNSKFLIEHNSYLNNYFKTNSPFTVVNSFITGTYNQIKNIKNIEIRKDHDANNIYKKNTYVLYLANNVEHHIMVENYKTHLYSFSEDNNKIECRHIEYKKNKKYMFPYISVLKIFSENEINLKIKSKNVIFDEPQKFKFKAPKRYEKIK